MKIQSLTESERINVINQANEAIVFGILVNRLAYGYPRSGFIGRLLRFFGLRWGWVGGDGLTGSEYQALRKLHDKLNMARE